ncbi:amino acid ABC transporter permease [Paracoccus sp. APAP_BH8]|uniref:Amino acid ABC transporter permease n=1 Tax=Paracoccus pantotrophus TaxID=82367 RepID=A0A7H9C1L0_PARPN|nr:amino acid ABC transporter permease [Paracoccus pantotrophus]MDF3854155.1 amino acid ABC transporter permease [Paracoccus pantotrophus]QLH16898.1 amino acid ABC transporter permease [Paracoccus pantotrophus]RNI14285.1 amino acid ABC transporter permease [Paracoccus pantotrophus]SFO25747.1 polar amino acid transport system permease protein [Paracoccus pantotrophus]
MDYTLDLGAVTRNMGPLMDGLWVTLQLTLAANVIGVIAGFALALLTTSKLAVLRLPSMLFVEFFRCTPAIVQIVWFFYCVPMIFNVFWGPVFMGIIALGLNLTAFNAEAYRASIQAVPREHLDAGIALGLSPTQRILNIVLPQALRNSVPVLLTNGIGIFQQSALVAIVGVADLMYQGKTLATATYRPIETFTVVALIYLAISYPVGQFVNWLERRQSHS